MKTRWSSISRGAAIKSMGFDDFNDDQPFPVVTSYISKAHYGIAFKEQFDSSKHTEEDRREFDEAKGVDLAWDQMRWYVNKVCARVQEISTCNLTGTKGDDVSKGDPKNMTWEFEQLDSERRTDYTIRVFECEASVAPPRKTSEVRECAIITFTASGNNLMFRESEGGQRFRIVRFDVRMTLQGMGKVNFTLWVNGNLAAKRDVHISVA
jgi:hypothetical protein